MLDLFKYLNEPILVANFQKLCGIEANFDRKTKSETINECKKLNGHTVKVLNNDDNLHNNKKHPEQDVIQKKHNRYEINNKFWFYFFHVGAQLGNEIFYSLFFPFWFWNIDGAIARKVSIVWAIFMYIGQATKDILEMPRPATPPVVKLEERYVQEYGFPSTHAMFAAGVPISLVYLSHLRYNINLPLSIVIAALSCLWICASRLYLGMHSILDVICGVLYSVFILILVLPFMDTIDRYQLTNSFAPFVLIIIGFTLSFCYPSLKRWSTARGDTTIILGTVVGFSIGSYLNYYFGFLYKPIFPPLYDINFPSFFEYFLVVIRTILGLLMLVATRSVFKRILFTSLCYIYNMDPKDPSTKQEKKIELPYYYITYMALGISTAFTSPLVFRLLHIARDYTFTEL